MALGKSFSWIRQFPLKKDFRGLGREDSPFPCQGEHSWVSPPQEATEQAVWGQNLPSFCYLLSLFPKSGSHPPFGQGWHWGLVPSPCSCLPSPSHTPSETTQFLWKQAQDGSAGGQGQYCWEWRRSGWQEIGIESKEQEVSSSHSQVETETC